jgi:hypothetical protein
MVILLRVRGNLYYAESEDKWHLRTVPSGQSWQLAFGRDLIDSSMLRAAKHMVWYPVCKTFFFNVFFHKKYRHWILLMTDH